MANKGDIYKVALPNGDEYNFKDKYVRENYRALNNNDYDTINVTELNSGNIINTGAARFLNTIDGSVSGTSSNVTGTVAIEHGGTGATTRLGAAQNLTNEAVSNPGYVVGLTTNWGKFGYTTIAQLKTAIGYDTTVTSGSSNLITSGAVAQAIDNLPEPMVFKGTLGTNGTITTLPTASASNEGYTYKVITAGTYASQAAKIGDVFVCAELTSGSYSWVLIPAGDTDSDSWRNIKINGAEKLTTVISSGAVDFVNGTNTTVSFNATGNKIQVDAVDTKYGISNSGSSVVLTAGGTGTSVSLDALLSNLPTWTANPTDDTYFIRQDTSGTNQFGRLKFSTMWNYFKGKADSVYSPIGHTHSYLPLAGGTLTGADCVFYTVNNTTKINANSASILQSPIPKYLWHDLFAFNRYCVPTFYITADGSTWTESTLNKSHFAELENIGELVIKGENQCGARWVWTSSSFKYSNGSWLLIGVGYTDPSATVTITFESSTDNSTWTLRHQSTHSGNSAPIWCKLDGYGASPYLRLTITKDPTDTTKSFNVGAIRLLTTRWGSQGGGSEYEYPYSWDADRNISMPGNLSVAGTIKQNGTAVSLDGHTHKYAGSSSAGGAANSLANFAVSTTGGLALENTTNIHGYVSGLTKADWNYQQVDGAIYAQFYSASWKHQIFGDYRTGHISLRGKNNGIWQNWLQVLDSGNIGYEMSSTVVYNPHLKKFTATKTDNAWTAQAYSRQGYINDVFLTFRPTQTTTYVMVGLDAYPSEDANYNKIDYCWYCQANGNLSMYESGTERTSISGHTTYSAGDELRVEYSAGEIRYYHNGVLCRTVTRAIGDKLYMDSSFYNSGSIYDVSFGNSVSKSSSSFTSDTATKATQDSDGNAINTTYLKKSGGTMTGQLTIQGSAASKPLVVRGICGYDGSGAEDALYLNYGNTTADTVFFGNTGGGAISSNGTQYSGNAATATLATTATQANSLATAVGTSAGARPVWYSYLGDNTKAVYDTAFTYNPSGSVLTATKFVGTLQGNADTATTSNQLAENTSYQDSTFIVHTDKSIFKTYLSRFKHLGIDASNNAGALVLAGTWSQGNYTSELALGFGDSYGIYYRGNNGSSEQAWQAVGRFSTTPTSGQVMITDGTKGGMKSSGFTIGKSVPSDAVFTDHYNWTDITNKPTSYTPSSGSFDYIMVTRGSSKSTASNGFWAAMCNSTQTGSPTLPTAGKWWHVLSMDWTGNDVNNWYSQLALPTQDGNSLYYRHNSTGASKSGIDNAPWVRVLDEKNYSSYALPLSGGTLTGNLTISHAASVDMSASSANPKITFSEGVQPVHLVYTDYDSYRSPAGLKVIGGADATPAWFEVEGALYTGGVLHASSGVNANTANSSTSGGISLYATNPNTYGIIFRGTGNQGTHGYVQGDWATYFTMDGADTRGWVFKNAASGKGNVASISSAGNMVLNGSLTVGGNATNTSGVRQVYNSTTQSLDFVFVA